MKKATFEEYAEAKKEIMSGGECKEYSDVDEYGRNHKVICCEDGNNFWEVTEDDTTEFWSTKHAESRKYVVERELARNAGTNMTENREKAIRRMKNLAYWFMGEMLKEEERGEKEKEAFEKAKETRELVVMISTAENNARVMKDCMKEAREAAEFLKDEKNDIEEWQLAGINAMFDQCNKENIVPYDMPTAIKGLLCMQYK